jgi:uncharacterized protein (TIGR03067 family)
MRSDLDHLAGTWNIVSLELEGQPMPAGMFGGASITIQGDRFTTAMMGAVYQGMITVDPSQNPRQFELHFTDGPEQGNRSLGIYELGENDWKICLTTTAKDRPAAFSTTSNSGTALESLKRKTA